MNRAEYRHAVLARLGCYQLAAFRALGAWELAESGPSDLGPGFCNGVPGEGAKWNPLNTTMPWPNSTDYNTSAHVKNYKTFVDGREATVKTLLLTQFRPIVDALRTDGGGVQPIFDAIGSTPWGTSTKGLEDAWQRYKDSPEEFNGYRIGV